MNITLYGAASEKIDRYYIDEVEELGCEMARRGHAMVFGAGSGGLMGAAARGLHREGGTIIGITPRFMHSVEPIYDHCTKLIHTDTLSERKDIMEKMADAFVIVPGGIGTFDEFFQILTLKKLGRHNKPIVLFNVRNFWDNMLGVIGSDIFKGFIGSDVAECISVSETPKTVVDLVERLVTENAAKKQ